MRGGLRVERGSETRSGGVLWALLGVVGRFGPRKFNGEIQQQRLGFGFRPERTPQDRERERDREPRIDGDHDAREREREQDQE